MEQQQQTKGVGKESQLSKIAAAVNPASQTEANPESTKSMISTFIKHFDSVALELINEMDDDQEKLVKNMVDEITKLQTKNIEEFQKAIGKIVGIANNMIESNNPKLQEMGQGLKDQATNELFTAKGITLTGDKDTFANRLGRQFGMNTEEEPAQGRKGIGKLARGAFSNIGRDITRGMKIAVGADIDQEGTFYDRVVRTDEEKRTRELSRLEQSSTETKTESIAETFKRSIEELIKEVKKSEKPSDEKDSKKDNGTPANSEKQEDTAGVSKDAQIEALQKTAESNAFIQQNSSESVDILGKLLEEVKKIAEIMITNGNQAGAGDGGGIMDMIPDIDLPRGRRRGRLSRIGRSISRGVRGLGRTVVGGARTVGGAVLRGGSAVMRGVGGLLGFGTAAAGAAGVGTAGAAGAAGLGGAAGAAGLGGAAGAAGLGGAAGAAGLATSTAGAAGAAGATGAAGKIVSGSKSLAAKAGGVLGKAGGILGKGLGVAGRVAGKLALPLAAGMALYDGYKGFTADPNATTGQKFKNAGRNVLSGLTFGLVDSTEDKIAKGEYTGTQKPVQGKAEPVSKKSEEGFFSKNKGMLMGAAVGPVGMLAGAAYDKMSSSTAKTETGRNVDSALIEAGTAATKEKMQINVPPPTVINQGSGGGNSAPTITAPGGVRNVRSDEPTWLMFQKRRAVA